MKSLMIAATALIVILYGSPVMAFEVSGLATPESFIVDPESGYYFISNINGAPTEKDNNGFITKLDSNGKVVALKFIDASKGAPLHAPKGLVIVGHALYVTDIDHIRIYDKTTGAVIGGLDPDGASFLNDLASDGKGNLYVSDMMSNFIGKIDTARRHAFSIVVKGPQLGQPNGLTINPKTNRLVMVNWEEGRMYEVAADGSLTPLLNQTFKNLDGVDFDAAGNLYFSSFTGGTIYKVTPAGKVSVFRENLQTPADINIDRKKNLLLIPSFNGNSAMTLPLQ